MNERISVIIPVHNAKKTIARTIDSIRNQTHKDLEIILVNDGSIDSSLNICNEYKKLDSRIVVVDKVNTGVGDTRNVGIDISTGEYICFIDSDDTINDCYLEKLYKTSKKYNCDIVTSNIKCIMGEMNFYPYNPSKNDPVFSQDQFMERFLNFFVGSAVWGKLYSRKAIGNNRFEKLNINEDFIFCWDVIKSSSIFSENGNAVYDYFLDNEKSLTKSKFSKDNMTMIKHIDTVLEDVTNYYPHMIADANNYYSACLLHNLIIYYNHICSENCDNLFLQEKEEMINRAKKASEIKNHFLIEESNFNINDLINKINEDESKGAMIR